MAVNTLKCNHWHHWAWKGHSRIYVVLLQTTVIMTLKLSDVSAATVTFFELASALREMSLRRAVSCHRRGSAGRSLVSNHDDLTFLSDLDGLPDPPCCPVRLTADDRRLVTVDDVILCVDVICDHWSILLVVTSHRKAALIMLQERHRYLSL